MRTVIYYFAIGLIILLQYCYCQRILYRCTFNSDVCGFYTDPVLLQLDTELPPEPDDQPPTRPLSDVTSILEVTTFNNERCDLPYEYPQGEWTMHFCTRTSNISNASFVCPTTTGYGICASGLYSFAITNGTGIYKESFSRAISDAVIGLQCLEFYYYLLNDDHSPTITFKWENLSRNQSTTIITQVKPQGENKWYQSRTTFNTNYSDYFLDFQFDREVSSPSYTFALDEISIAEGRCESTSTDTTSDNLITTQSDGTSTIFTETSTGIDPISSTNTPSLSSDSSISTTIFLTEKSTTSSLPTSSPETTKSDTSLYSTSLPSSSIELSTTTPIKSPNDNQDMSLILGLSLGIGIPVLSVIIGSIIYYLKKIRPNKKILVTHDKNDIPLIQTNNTL